MAQIRKNIDAVHARVYAFARQLKGINVEDQSIFTFPASSESVLDLPVGCVALRDASPVLLAGLRNIYLEDIRQWHPTRANRQMAQVWDNIIQRLGQQAPRAPGTEPLIDEFDARLKTVAADAATTATSRAHAKLLNGDVFERVGSMRIAWRDAAVEVLSPTSTNLVLRSGPSDETDHSISISHHAAITLGPFEQLFQPLAAFADHVSPKQGVLPQTVLMGLAESVAKTSTTFSERMAEMKAVTTAMPNHERLALDSFFKEFHKAFGSLLKGCVVSQRDRLLAEVWGAHTDALTLELESKLEQAPEITEPVCKDVTATVSNRKASTFKKAFKAYFAASGVPEKTMTAITTFCGGSNELGDAGVNQKVVLIERLYALMAIAQSALRLVKAG